MKARKVRKRKESTVCFLDNAFFMLFFYKGKMERSAFEPLDSYQFHLRARRSCMEISSSSDLSSGRKGRLNLSLEGKSISFSSDLLGIAKSIPHT